MLLLGKNAKQAPGELPPTVTVPDLLLHINVIDLNYILVI